MSFLSQRIQNLPMSQTIAMAQKARALKAEGKDVINLSLGEPDFFTPDPIKLAAKKAIDDNKSFYTPVAGTPALRQAIVDKFERDNGIEVTPEHIVISTGAKQSIANVVLALVNPGDEVLLPAPYWVSYPQIVQLAEGVCKPVATQADNQYKLTADELERAITPKTKLIILSSPCNPSGGVYTDDEFAKLAEVLARHPQVFCLCDEIYEHINFTGQHASLATQEHIKDQVITVNGLSKGFAMTGWRLGYMAATPMLAKACEKVQGQFTSGACSVTQEAAIEALSLDKSALQPMLSAYAARREVLFEGLSQLPGFKVTKPDGAFYMFPDISHWFGKKHDGGTIESANDLSMYLLDTAHVACVTGSAFGQNNCLRLCFAIDESRLKEACERIGQALAGLS